MLIDGFTVFAQMVNFLILVWLLKAFLYKPLLEALDERQKRIDTDLSEASRRQEEASREREELKKSRAEFELGREERMKTVQAEVDALRARLTEEARRNVAGLEEQWTRRIAEDQASWRRRIAELTGREVVALSRKILRDMADSGLENALVQAFLREMETLPESEKLEWEKMARQDGCLIQVRSAFELPPDLRELVSGKLRGMLDGLDSPQGGAQSLRLEFVTAPELIAGIECVAGGRKAAWTFAEYLSSIEERFSALVESEGTVAK